MLGNGIENGAFQCPRCNWLMPVVPRPKVYAYSSVAANFMVMTLLWLVSESKGVFLCITMSMETYISSIQDGLVLSS